jgi:hypothetical protein
MQETAVISAFDALTTAAGWSAIVALPEFSAKTTYIVNKSHLANMERLGDTTSTLLITTA